MGRDRTPGSDHCDLLVSPWTGWRYAEREGFWVWWSWPILQVYNAIDHGHRLTCVDSRHLWPWSEWQGLDPFANPGYKGS